MVQNFIMVCFMCAQTSYCRFNLRNCFCLCCHCNFSLWLILANSLSQPVLPVHLVTAKAELLLMVMCDHHKVNTILQPGRRCLRIIERSVVTAFPPLSFKSFWLHFAEYLLKALELFCKFDVLLLHVSV